MKSETAAARRTSWFWRVQDFAGGLGQYQGQMAGFAQQSDVQLAAIVPCPTELPQSGAAGSSLEGYPYANITRLNGEPQECQGGPGYNSWYGNGQINALKAVTHRPGGYLLAAVTGALIRGDEVPGSLSPLVPVFAVMIGLISWFTSRNSRTAFCFTSSMSFLRSVM